MDAWRESLQGAPVGRVARQPFIADQRETGSRHGGWHDAADRLPASRAPGRTDGGGRQAAHRAGGQARRVASSCHPAAASAAAAATLRVGPSQASGEVRKQGAGPERSTNGPEGTHGGVRPGLLEP